MTGLLATRSAPQALDSPRVAAPRMSCAHCGLPVAAAQVRAGAELQFCCAGCRQVYVLLSDAGLAEYYDFRTRLGATGSSVDIPDGKFQEFDTAGFRELYCTSLPDGSQRTEVSLEGVHCAACVWLVERLPRLEPSVRSARLNLSRASLELEWYPTSPEESAPARGAPLSQIARTLAQLGYKARPLRGLRAQERHRALLRGLIIRMGIAGAAAGNVMLMAFALYSGAGSEVLGTAAGTPGVGRLFHWASLLVSIPALLAGSLFFRGALAAVRTRTPHMDLPICIGITAGFSWGVWGVLTGSGEIYFDSITSLIFLLLVGRYLQARHQLHTSEAAELIHAVTPAEAARVRASAVARVACDGGAALPNEALTSFLGELESVPVDALAAADWVYVRSGEVCPVDGSVLCGVSTVDRSLLSGESVPQLVEPFAAVEAGALNLGAPLLVLVHEAGARTRVARLMKEVERALSQRTPVVLTADRWAGVFTILVIGLAVVTFLAHLPSGVEPALEIALALLIVACPCALGLATPLALSAGVGRAARSRKLIFSPESLEELARPATILLDKTGTLTEGRLCVVDRVGDDSFDPLVCVMESDAHHPAGQALRAHLIEAGAGARTQTWRGRTPPAEVLGFGLRWDLDVGVALLGSERFVLCEASIEPDLQHQVSQREATWSPIYFALDGRVRCVYFLADRVRPDARESLRVLRSLGHELLLISGDNDKTVAAVARELSSESPDLFREVRGDQTPENKLMLVRELRAKGQRVVMVGDGVNDSGALAAASVGIAVSGAAEVSRLSADIFLARPYVSELSDLCVGARRVLRTIRRGILFSLGYNLVGVGLASLGFLGPLGAAILMPLSSLTVVTHAYRSRTFRLAEKTPEGIAGGPALGGPALGPGSLLAAAGALGPNKGANS